MKMKRKSIALLLALMMCLSLLSACGADNTPDAGELPVPENTSGPTGQQMAEDKEEEPTEEKQAEAEKPTQEKQEETEEKQAETEEPEEKNNTGAEFLALLQEEYENGFFQGEGPRHTCYTGPHFINNGVIYISKNGYNNGEYATYDIATKEFNENFCSFSDYVRFCIDGNCYCKYNENVSMYDGNGALLNSVGEFDGGSIDRWLPFENGFLCSLWDGNNQAMLLLSYSLEKIAEIPIPQREVEHGLKENMRFDGNWFAADGTVYAEFLDDDSLYRLNTDTYEWENIGNAPTFPVSRGDYFFGKYFSYGDGIYDRVTGERVFEYGELYRSPLSYDGLDVSQCYFGGDKYLGFNGDEFRWVSLTDMSMSDPLPFPEYFGSGGVDTILDDTYCIYSDEYGVFLRNYNDGTEETIMMYDN